MLRLYQRSLDEMLSELPAAAPEGVVMVRTEVSPPDDYLDRAVARATKQMTS